MRSLIILAATIGLLFLADPASAATDNDGDDWSNEYEDYLPTGKNRACPLTAGDAAWPPDLDNDTFVDSADMAVLSDDFGKSVNDANVLHREDIGPWTPTATQGNGFIDTGDMSAISNRFDTSCTP